MPIKEWGMRMRNLWCLVVFMFAGCVTHRQCVDTCETVVRYQAEEMSSRQIQKDADCMMQKMDLDECRDQLNALPKRCR